MNKPLWMVVTGWAISSMGLAAPPGAPLRPIPKPAPVFASWLITFSPSLEEVESAESGANRPRMLSVRVTKTRNVRREIISWTSGIQTENWVVGGLSLARDPLSGELITESRSEVASVDLGKNDYSLLLWITPETPLKLEKFKGMPCYLFEAHLPLVETSPGRLGLDPLAEAKFPLGRIRRIPTQRAYVSIATRLPVAVESNGRWGIFEWGPPPTETLNVPPEVTSAIRFWNEKSRHALRVPEAP